MQIIATRNSGGQTVRYVTTDAPGSADRIIDSAGASLANLSFSAYGSRRGSAWQGGPTSGDQTQIRNATRRGFTWHEHLDNVGLIHMNGRVYDPAIGRFASADPFVQAPYDSQGLNRYSYVGNKPLSRIDPSGFSEIVPKRLIGDPRIDESGSGMDSVTVWGRRETVHTVGSGMGFSYSTGRSSPAGRGSGTSRTAATDSAKGGNPAEVVTVTAKCVNSQGACTESGTRGGVPHVRFETGPGEGAARAGLALYHDPDTSDEAKATIAAAGISLMVGGTAIALLPSAETLTAAVASSRYFGPSGPIFGRRAWGGSSVLGINNNAWFRMGWGWRGTAMDGQHVFRLSGKVVEFFSERGHIDILVVARGASL